VRARPVALDRTSQGRVRMTLALRAGNHAALAARAVGYNGRSRRWLAVLAASAAIDATLARLLADPDYLPGWRQRLVEWLDTGLWAFTTDDHHDVVPLLSSGAMPATMETAFGVAAGDQALPVYDPRRPWPPEDGADAARRVGQLLAAGVVPVGVVAAVRRGRRLPDSGAKHVVWMVAAFALTAAGARHRERLHRAERRRWSERTASQVGFEFDATQASLAMRSSPGHDFKKTLVALGLYGSARAAAEAHGQADRPRALTARLDGATLFDVTRSTRLHPPEAATLWLSPAQARVVNDFLARAEEEAVDGADHRIRVTRPSARETLIDHLGLQLRLRNDPPPLRARLYPTSPTLLLAAFQAGDNAILGGLPAWAVAAPSALLALMARRYWHRPPDDDELDRLVLGVTASAAMGFAVCASPVADDARGSFPANPFAKGSLTVLGAHWGRLAPRHKAAAALILAGWAAASVHRRRRDPAELVVAALDLLQAVAAAWRHTDLVDAEAHHLEAALQAEFTSACDAARREATRTELDRYRVQLDLARDEIAALASRGGLDPAVRAGLEDDCDELARWLAHQERAVAATGGVTGPGSAG
jgi:hypothetical protein